jgi:hypothetical protein
MVYRTTDCHSERSEESCFLRILRRLAEFTWRQRTEIPPEGSPTRSLHLAVQSARALAFLSFGIAPILGFAILKDWPFPEADVCLVIWVFILTSGIMYFVFAGYLKDYCIWAATGLLVLASVHGLLGFLPIGAVVFGPLRADLAPASLVLSLAWIALCARFICHIFRSYAAIRFKLGTEPRGFEVIMPSGKPISAEPLPAEPVEDPLDSPETPEP